MKERNTTSPAAASELPWERHGRLRVSEDGHHLQHEDGTPFFWLGDTAWPLHQNLSREDVQYYLDDAAAARFSVVQLMAVNHWALREGRNFYGEPPYRDDDATSLNPSYWEHLAWVVDEAARRGLYVLLVYGCPGRTDERMPYVTSAEQAYVYGNALGRLLRDRPNLIWCNGIDVNPDDAERVSAMGMEGWHAMAKGVADGVNGADSFDGSTDFRAVLMSYHPRGASTSSTWFHEAPWLDFNGAQVGLHRNVEGADFVWRTISADYWKSPPKPVVNLEPWYEECQWKEPPVSDWDARVQAYQSLFAGACGHTYGHHIIWPLDSPRMNEKGRWKAKLDAPGRVQMRHVHALTVSQPLLTRVPMADLVVASPNDDHTSQKIRWRISATGGADGRYAFVYSPRGERFSVDTRRLSGTSVHARWHDPRTGGSQAIGADAPRASREFDPPGDPGEGNDWVLVLEGR